MKRLGKTLGLLVAVAGLCFIIPIVVWNARLKGIDGYYEYGQCNCGYPGFMEIRDCKCFELFTGHKERDLLGAMEQSGDHWTLASSGSEIWIFRHVDGGLSITTAKGYTFEKQRIINPWRIWMRWRL